MADKKILAEEILDEDELEQVSGGWFSDVLTCQAPQGLSTSNKKKSAYEEYLEEKRKQEEQQKLEEQKRLEAYQKGLEYILSQPEVKDFFNNLWQKMNGK